MKQIVVIKSSKSVLSINPEFLEIKNFYEDRIIGLRNIKALYINQTILIKPSEIIKISEFFEVFFINQYGHILATIKVLKDETI